MHAAQYKGGYERCKWQYSSQSQQCMLCWRMFRSRYAAAGDVVNVEVFQDLLELCS